MNVVGADVASGRWVVARIDDSAVVEVVELDHFDEVVVWSDGAAVIGVDIPIDLGDEPRRCDLEARAALGSRASTLFLIPTRTVLAAADYASARSLAARRGEPGVTAQAFNLRTKIFEVEPHAQSDRRLHEVHPELSFAVMAGAVVTEPKSTWNGQMRRRRLLADAGLEIPDRLIGVNKSAPDDVLDAVAVAWSARRIAMGTAERMPAGGDGAAIWR